MPKARVIFDVHGYRDGDETVHANKGEIIEVSAAELDRGLEIGSLEKVSAKDAKAAEAEAPDPKVAGTGDPDEPTTPAGDPAGDGKHDQDA